MIITMMHVDFIAEAAMFNGSDVITEYSITNYLESREFTKSELSAANDVMDFIKRTFPGI